LGWCMRNIGLASMEDCHLVTGSGSGLGRYLHERIGGSGVTRDTILIHCAHKFVKEEDQEAFTENVILAKKAVLIPHKKMVFISSGDVYRDSYNGTCKKMCEGIILKADPETLIIRICGLIMGKHQRSNCISKILGNPTSIKLNLAPKGAPHSKPSIVS